MAKKKKAAKRKAKPTSINVRLAALGNSEIPVKVKPGTTLGSFIKNEIPKKWDLSTAEITVGGMERDHGYYLNDGDLIAVVPNVEGGRKVVFKILF